MKLGLKLILFSLLAVVFATAVTAAGNLTVSEPTATTLNVSETVNKQVTFTNADTAHNITVTLPTTVNLIGTVNNETGVSVSYKNTSGTTMSSTFNLLNGTAKVVNVSFAIPSDSYSEVYSGVINFTSGQAGSYDTSTFAVTVNAAPVSGTLSTPASITVAQNHSRSLYANFTNTANTNLNNAAVTVGDLTSGSDVLRAENITLASSTVSAVYGSYGTVQATVAVPESQATGTYTGTMTVNYGGTSNATATMTVVVESRNYNFDISSSLLTFPAADQNTTVTRNLIIQNTGNLPINGVTVSNSSIDGEYLLSFNTTNLGTMDAGESESVLATVFVPVEEQGGIHSIGNILVAGTEYTETFDLSLNVEGKLQIDDLDVSVGSSTDSGVIDGETVDKDAKPGDEVKLRFKIENMFTDDEDVDIDDIVIKAVIEGIDDGDDLDEESDEFDLNADSSKTVTLTFDLPEDAADGSYEIIIDVEGEDSEDRNHEIHWEIDFDVERKSHEVKITKAVIGSSTLSCTRYTTFTVTALNIGSSDEDEVVMTVYNKDLGIDETEKFSLESDPDNDDNKETIILQVEASDNLEAKVYPLEVKLYYDTDNLDDYASADLEIIDCSSTSTTTTTPAVTIPTDSTADDTETTSDSTTVSVGSSTSSRGIPIATSIAASPMTTISKLRDSESVSSAGAVALLVIVNLAVVGSIIFLILKFLVFVPK